MRRLLALVITLAAAIWVRGEAARQMTDAHSAALALGFALIAAVLAGGLLERIRLPRITGYMLFGLVCGPYFANIITRPMARELQLVNGLAVSLIAFIAGLEINAERLRPRLPAILRLGGVTIAFMDASLFVIFWVIWPWLPVYPEAAGLLKLALVALVTTVVSCSSPTVAIAVIAETRAAGLLSELVIAVVILNDLILIVSFALVMQLVHAASGGLGSTEVGLMTGLSWRLMGSFAFGAFTGALFSLYLKYVGRELVVVLMALCAVLTAVGAQLDLEPVLSALTAGLVVENVAPSTGTLLRGAVERGALPVLVIFFAAAGASLQLDAVYALGVTALALSATRMGLLKLGTTLGVRTSGLPQDVGRVFWMGLVSQAGVTLGLSMVVAAEYPTWGVRLQTLVIAFITLHQLIGPVLFRAALERVGEIGKMNTRPAPA